MGTVDMTAGSNAAPLGATQHPRKISNILDFDDFTVATGDVLQFLDIPAKTFVKWVFVEVIRPAVAATAYTMTVGDGAAAAGFDATVNLQAAAGTITLSTEGTDASSTAGKVYSADDTIDGTMTITGAVTTKPKIKVTALVLDLSV